MGSARETREGLRLLAALGVIAGDRQGAVDRKWDRVCAVLYRGMRE
jgi:hypothetical protein